MRVYMLMNNNTILLVIVCNDLYVKKIDNVVWGADSPYPFCDVNRGRLCLQCVE